MPARRLVKDDGALWQSYKRQSIQQAVIRLMCREGLKSVTMERVAQEVGIAKGTVYLHYRDKQALLDDVKESSLAPVTAKMDEIFASDSSPERKLQAYTLRYLGYFDERRDLFRILLYEREVVRVHGSRYRGDRYRHLVEEVTKVIEQGMRAASFRKVDARGVASMFVEANFAMLNQRLLTERPRPVEEDAETISDLFIRGLRPLDDDEIPRRRSFR
jgi:TetR/AcrR family transcriptional regulator, fatty acid metabolism regulator protein